MVLHPVGPEPASTYWFRRVVVVLVVVVALLGLRACVRSDSPKTAGHVAPTSTPTATPSPSPSTTASTTPGPTGTPAPAGTCADADLKLVVSTDESTYPVGGTPTFTMVVTNTSAAPCTRDLGPTAVSFLVVSGPARQWSSDDCQPATGHKPTVLSPGKATQAAQITWSGKTSRVGCPTPRQPADAGTYQVSGSVGTLTSARVVFHFR